MMPPGFGMMALQRAAIGLGAACVALPMSLAHAGQAAPCESARVYLDASDKGLKKRGFPNCADYSQSSQEDKAACLQYTDALTKLNDCEEQYRIGDPLQRMLNRDQARLFQVRVFIDELRTGMTAVEIQLTAKSNTALGTRFKEC
jgi:hypothetical protein